MELKNNKMKELIPIVAKLAEQQNGYESTSITYEKAQSLMAAVVYCINEYEMSNENGLVEQELSAKEMYQRGYTLVVQKVNKMREIYNSMIEHFHSYGNQCLDDTVIKGISEFLKWYDAKYEPQDTILTLDYPILKDISKYSGIDAIYEYVKCIYCEQEFLQKFNSEFIESILRKYSNAYEDMVENILSPVLQNVIGHLLIKKVLNEQEFSQNDYEQIKGMFAGSSKGEIKEKLASIAQEYLYDFYDNGDMLREYMSGELTNIAFRIKHAIEYDTLEQLF